MVSVMMRGVTAAILLAGASVLAVAQSGPATGPQNSTTGAASADIPNPPVVRHIPSANDAAKFNQTADTGDKKPTMAHALALTDEQRRFISASIAGKAENSGQPDFKPQVAALMPKSAKPQDLPGGVGAKIP